MWVKIILKSKKYFSTDLTDFFDIFIESVVIITVSN